MADPPRLTALKLLLRLESRKARIDALLAPVLSDNSMPDTDKAFVSELVYGVTRWRRALDAIIAKASSTPPGKMDQPVLVLLRMGAYQLAGMTKAPAYAAVNETVNIAKGHKKARHLTGFINGVLRGVARLVEKKRGAPLWKIVKELQPAATLGETHSFPDWLVERWLENFGEAATVRILKESNKRAPVFFRLNTLKIGREEFEAGISEWGMSAERLDWARDGYRLTEGKLTPDSPAVSEGLVQPQDASTIVAPSLLAPEKGDIVSDVCCGKGIKSGALAQWMENDGTILAMDIYPQRLSMLAANMARLDVKICRPVAADAASTWPVGVAFKKILVDAPCSSTGVLRRRPEGKWNKGPELSGEMAALQYDMLSRAADSLAPGGTLVYSVCSIEPEEGALVIERFLSARADMARDDIKKGMPALSRFLDERGDVFILPGDGGMDGFYAVRLVKKGR